MRSFLQSIVTEQLALPSLDFEKLSAALSDELLQEGMLDAKSCQSLLAILDHPQFFRDGESIYGFLSNLWLSETCQIWSKDRDLLFAKVSEAIVIRCSQNFPVEVQYVIGDAIAHLALDNNIFYELVRKCRDRNLRIVEAMARASRDVLKVDIGEL